jgi:hypothetical protein
MTPSSLSVKLSQPVDGLRARPVIRRRTHDDPGLREVHSDLTEIPFTHRMRRWIFDGPQQGSDSLHLFAECILTVLPVGFQSVRDHVSSLGSVAFNSGCAAVP